MGGKKEQPSLFRTALQRLSFRSKKKKYSLVIEQRQGADASADSTLIETEEVENIKSEVAVDDTKAATTPPHPHNCPSTPSSCWRQKPPPAHYDLDWEMEKLRCSRRTANRSRISEVEEKTELGQLKDSKLSIDTASLATEKDTMVEEHKKVARAQSMTVLDMTEQKEKIQVSRCLDNC